MRVTFFKALFEHLHYLVEHAIKLFSFKIQTSCYCFSDYAKKKKKIFVDFLIIKLVVIYVSVLSPAHLNNTVIMPITMITLVTITVMIPLHP